MGGAVLKGRRGEGFSRLVPWLAYDRWYPWPFSLIFDLLSPFDETDPEITKVLTTVSDLDRRRLRPGYVSAEDIQAAAAVLAARAADPARRRVILAVFERMQVENPSEGAEGCIRRALAGEDPPWASDMLFRARFLDAGDPVAARRLADELPPDDVRRADVLRAVARVARIALLDHRGDESANEAAIERAEAEADDHERRVLGRLGELLVAARRFDKEFDHDPAAKADTIAQLLEAREIVLPHLSPEALPTLRYAQAWLAHARDDRIAARRHLDDALACPNLGGFEGDLLQALATLEYLDGNIEAELRCLRRAFSITDGMEVFHDLDVALRQTGRADEADRAWEELLGRVATFAPAGQVYLLRKLADIRYERGDKQAGFELATRAIWACPTVWHYQDSLVGHLLSAWAKGSDVDQTWARRGYEEVLRFEEARRGHPSLETLDKLVHLATARDDLDEIVRLRLLAAPLVPDRERESFRDLLVKLAYRCYRLKKPALALQLFEAAVRLAELEGDPETVFHMRECVAGAKEEIEIGRTAPPARP
jgi:tetratricopeptide (TPR) repeat protein